MYRLWLFDPVSRGPKSTIRWKSARTRCGDGSGIGFRAARNAERARGARLAASAESPTAAAPPPLRTSRRVSGAPPPVPITEMGTTSALAARRRSAGGGRRGRLLHRLEPREQQHEHRAVELVRYGVTLEQLLERDTVGHRTDHEGQDRKSVVEGKSV